MRFHKFNILLTCSATALLSACDIYESVPLFERIEKTPIEFTIGGADGPMDTRALITTGTDKVLSPFGKDAKVFMVMKSEYGTDDYQGDRTTKYTATRGNVEYGVTTTVDGKTVNPIAFTGKNWRYWDDAHARSSMLSIWAYAQMGTPNTPAANTVTFDGQSFDTEQAPTPQWSTTEIVPSVIWKTSTETNAGQTAATLVSQDLLFSNNLTNYTPDRRLKFDFTSRKFPTGATNKMIFYHAMAKMTINIIEGEGFDATSTADFQFTRSGENVKLTGFNTEGKFSIAEGKFQQIDAAASTPSLPCTNANTAAPASPKYVLEALVVPNIYEVNSADEGSRFVKDDSNTMMEFTIDNNTYRISSGTLYSLLLKDDDTPKTNATQKTDHGTYIPLEGGKNYIFTFTVGKKKIDNLTAQVVDWESVEASEHHPSNARIKLRLEERGANISAPADIYRATDNSTEITDSWESYLWNKGYKGNSNVFKDNGSGTWQLTSNWFWADNKTHYHFRALMPGNGTTGAPTVETADEKDYVTLTSASSYTDLCWGAPMLDDGPNETPGTFKWNYGPTTNGFDGLDTKAASAHQIYKAIGPTEDAIKLILFHMMSDLTFKITTTTDDDKIDLGNGSTYKPIVEIIGIKENGKVLLGNGLVQTTGDASTAIVVQNSFTEGSSSVAPKCVYTFGAVPQGLTGIQLRITTPDHNRYIVDLKDILATSVTSANLSNPYKQESGKFVIDRWYPGFKYVYNLVLKKKEQVDFKATVVDWETVTVDNENVQIR